MQETLPSAVAPAAPATSGSVKLARLADDAGNRPIWCDRFDVSFGAAELARS